MLQNSAPLPLNSLHVFEVAARHLSFTAAARELDTTQPAISQQIRTLEGYLGAPLFTRVYRGVELTPAGRKLFNVAQVSLGSLRNTLSEIRNQKPVPRIVVATDFAFAAFWLLVRLPEFRRAYPHIDIHIQTSQSEIDIASGEADVAIQFGGGDYQGCTSQRLIPEQVFPVCSPSYLAEHGPIESLAGLADQSLLALESGTANRWLDWPGFFRESRSTVAPKEPVLEFNNYTLLTQAAIAGQGIGLGWGTVVDRLLDDGLLVALPQFHVQTRHGYFLVLPDTTEHPDPVRDFAHWLAERLS